MNGFKILLVGDTSVGKTCIMLQYTQERFDDVRVPTVGIDFALKNITLDNNTYKLQIWDTAGQERFRNITTVYYRSSHGIILVYDVSNQDSFDHLLKWLEEIDRYAGEDVPKIIVGNKIDLNREVSYEVAQSFADSLNIPYFEVSAKSKSDINNIFEFIAIEIKKNIKLTETSTVVIENKPPNDDCLC